MIRRNGTGSKTWRWENRVDKYKFTIGFTNLTTLVFTKEFGHSIGREESETPIGVARHIIKNGYWDVEDNMLFSPNIISTVFWQEIDD